MSKMHCSNSGLLNLYNERLSLDRNVITITSFIVLVKFYFKNNIIRNSKFFTPAFNVFPTTIYFTPKFHSSMFIRQNIGKDIEIFTLFYFLIDQDLLSYNRQSVTPYILLLLEIPKI